MTSRRPQCERCLRPMRSCVCGWIRETPSPVEVLILQHPMEVHEAKGSGRLLHLSLKNSRLAIGETFDADTLQQLLYAPWSDTGNTAHPLLLYPDDAGQAIVESSFAFNSNMRLIVLDATWRKSRKMLYTNPQLSALPRLSLENLPASRYLIRKAHGVDQHSTLEATCHALAMLDNQTSAYEPLLQAFSGFVLERQAFATAVSSASQHSISTSSDEEASKQ